MKSTLFISCFAASFAFAQPPDRPEHGVGDKAVEAHERTLKPLIAKARATYPQAKSRFLKGLPAGEGFYVMTRLSGERGLKTEDVFVEVRAIKGGMIEGTIDSEIELVQPHHKGEKITFSESSIMDWTILHAGGVEEGNVIGKYMDAHRK